MSAETVPNRFNSPPPPDNDEQRKTLAQELRFADGFALLFAICNSAEERARQIAALREENPDLAIREFALRQDTYHLLDVLRPELTEPLPDVICVYGMENWIRSDVPPRSVPFLLNLNAGRNHFVKEFPCPLLFWVPEYLFAHIAEAAPDFFSIRSGIYVFASFSSHDREAPHTVQWLNYYKTLGFSLEMKQQRLEELTVLLERIRDLPEDQIRSSDEAHTLSNLAMLHYELGHYQQAELLLKDALAIYEETVGRKHHDTASVLSDLGWVYVNQERENEAEKLYLEAIGIYERSVGRVHSDTAETLHNLAGLYHWQGEYSKARKLYNEVLNIRKSVMSAESPEVASVLQDLGGLYADEEENAKAEASLREALEIFEKTLGRKHPSTATTLYVLAELYAQQGKYAEAEALATEAVQIMMTFLGEAHPNTQAVKRTLEEIQRLSGK